MPISTSNVFHFTSSSENLISILEHNFRPHFCLEDLTVIMPDSSNQADLVFAIPMVSFCDIPLSQVSPHLKRYGYYGIGLSKKWAIRSGLAPVIYVVRGSPLASTLYSIILQLSTLPRDRNGNSLAIDSFHNLSTYLKPYEGTSPHDVTHASQRFFDEREWRFVPDLTGRPHLYGLTKDEFLDKDKRTAANSYLWNKSKLSFSPNDIKYIIVRREDEILDMICKIGYIKERFPDKQVQLLASRIISYSQIRNDF